MNEREDHLCEIAIGAEDEHLNTVQSSAELIMCRPTFTYIPVYNTRNNVYRDIGETLDANIEDNTAKPEQLKCLDFGMELTKNRVFFNWLDHKKLNPLTNTLFIIIVIIFLWVFFGQLKQITIIEHEMDSCVLIVLLYVATSVSGKIISMVSKIPPCIGMILTGMAIKNSGIMPTDEKMFSPLWLYLSELMESVILIISGLELNIFELRKTSGVVLKLAFLPQIAETVAVVLIVHLIWPKFINSWFEIFLLMNLSGINSFLFMSSLEKLKHLGYFDTNNIYTLLNAASTVIDMAAVIFNYSVIDLLNGPNSKIKTVSITHIAMEVSIDIVFGIFWGLLIVFVASPNWSKQYNLQECADNNSQVFNRQITSLLTILKSVALFFIGGIFISLFKKNIGIIWSYSLSCGISSIVAGTCWRWRIRKYDNNNVLTPTYNDGFEYHNQVYAILKVFKNFWKYLQPLFFGYIGTGFQAEYFSFWMLLIAPLVVVFELIIRVISTTFSVWGSGFNRNELLFINIAWLPNSTLMACLATTYLMVLRDEGHPDFNLICKIFNLTIIFYLMTSILGSFTVLNYGPLLLSTTVNINNNQDDNE